jgi:hypothetical protein
VWFTACWLFAAQTDGISALSLQRGLDIGSYQTAWAMLHRLRSVLVAPGRDRLSGTVEVDETFFGGEEPGLRGGRPKGKKVLVGIAVERKEPKGYGRCRMAILRDGSSASLHAFVTAHLEPGATVVNDAWPSYHGIDKLGYIHEPHSQRAASARGEDISALLPGVHRVPPSSSGGTSARIRVVSTTHISRTISMSSPFASTDADRGVEGWSSTDSCSLPSTTTQCATGSSWLIRLQRRCSLAADKAGPLAEHGPSPGRQTLEGGVSSGGRSDLDPRVSDGAAFLSARR